MNPPNAVFDATLWLLGGVGAFGPAHHGTMAQCVGWPGGVQGRVVDFQGDRSFSEAFTLPGVEAEAWLPALGDFCSGPLEVQGVWDTSDVRCRLVLDVLHNGRRGHVDVHMMASGFEGADAARLQRAVMALARLTGLPHEELQMGSEPPLEIERGLYGMGGDLGDLAAQLSRVLGCTLNFCHSPQGDYFRSFELPAEARARARAAGETRRVRWLESNAGPHRLRIVLEHNRHDGDYSTWRTHADSSPVVLTAAGVPAMLDAIESRLGEAGLHFRLLERAVLPGPPPPR